MWYCSCGADFNLWSEAGVGGGIRVVPFMDIPRDALWPKAIIDWFGVQCKHQYIVRRRLWSVNDVVVVWCVLTYASEIEDANLFSSRTQHSFSASPSRFSALHSTLICDVVAVPREFCKLAALAAKEYRRWDRDGSGMLF